MTHDELESLQHLWDGSEKWVLWASYHSEVDLKIVFESDSPTVAELLALRKVLEEYRNIPVHQVKADVGNTKELALGTRSTVEAEPILRHARELGLMVVETDASYTGYTPFNETDQSVLLIEHDDLSEQVINEMLEAGVPIVEQIEVD